ncbi:Rho guanine nucleotide exchange factor 33 [Oryzias melastigma]|uniref:Rho guanine nucleotide exchange factor (GEF) 33 n=1 Tax=Oryzias melastigma TaxID=30732 RepID=A0A3B3CUT4_ORYME|nr:rho guanine nucleotide exchange factor 33 isoform X2 [Oryzias melastigma]KAF6725631.1 Rho guanine nucleotide exchange factor 33 [Oryzias melastigma]
MENGQSESVEKTEEKLEEINQTVEGPTLETAQLQGLLVELRQGLQAALMELSELRKRDHNLEEKLQAHQTDADDKIMSLKNSLNTFKEELGVALFHIKEVSSRQRDTQRLVEVLQSEHVIALPHSRKSSRADVLTVADQHICAPGQSELSVFQHSFPTLPLSESPQRSTNSTQTSASEQETQHQRSCSSRSPVWEERSGRDETDVQDCPPENNKRQRAALELLESERVYVSHLSLLLKANISFNGSEALASKDKRPFPSSLRFLIQQHLELLHTLQERVLKCQWKGIMGDVFMRLTSKESDFLDFYVSYLKELPDCLSVVTMLASSSSKSSAFLESDIIGDESKPSLHTLLLQPVQRIPEYLLLLQGLLRQTDAEHPDYYLLVVCIQQFRSFTAQYHHLLQHNQELLLLNRKEVKRSTMKQLLKTVESGIQTNNIGSPYPGSGAMLEHANMVRRRKQCLLEQIQSHSFQSWDCDQDSENRYDADWPTQLPFFGSDPDPRNQKQTGLGSIPEADMSDRSTSGQHHLPSRPAEFRQVQPGSALADALGEFLLPPDPPGMESLYDEDGGSLQDAPLFDRCSSASSDSSIDIAFVKCPKGPSASHHAIATNVPTNRNVFGNGGNQGNGFSKPASRGCVSPDEAVMTRRNLHRPLQASQRKSKSLNGLQMENTVSLDAGLSDHMQKVGMGSHAKLERQGSKGSKGCSTPSHKIHSPLGTADKQNTDLHGLLSIDSSIQSWGDESKWRMEENHTSFSERSRKDKGGFRSSFKKLFKKKSGDERKAGEKTPEHQTSGEHDTPGKNPKLIHLEINRGTAV